MKRRTIFSLVAASLTASACSDQPVEPQSSDARPSFETSGGERIGTEKAPPGEFSAAATVSVLNLTGSGGAAALAQSLAGAGVMIQNVAYQGTTQSSGTFSDGASTVGFESGVILSSGWATDVTGPNSATNTTRELGTAGDAQLGAIVFPRPTFDATVLTFEIIPDADKVFFEYVFGSEEYNEYVGSAFNDVFAFFINGTNCAVAGTPPVPVTVNTINSGQNSALFRNNISPSTIDLEPDGLTTVLVCEATVIPNAVNTVKLAIADASDRILDSWVFIKAGSFSTTPPANVAPTLALIPAQSVDEGSELSFTAVGSDSDPEQTLSYSLLPGAPAGASINATTGVFTWTPADDDPTATPSDEVLVTVVVTDDAVPALSAQQEVVITVNNVAPTLGAFTTFPLAPVALGGSVSFSAPFGDPGSADTFTGEIDWGDGTTSAATIVPFTSIAGSHTYTGAGVYTVSLTITDDDGGTDVATYQYAVVYDPSAGFVTGGGWIESPAGAYGADPTLTGRASFGFVSKYKKGATTPDGQTQFQFQTAGLKFHSTVYEWLVIAGSRAQYKGSGTINGAGDYGFLLTARDGQAAGGGGVDRFRIKIWDKSTGTIIYDNQIGDPDDGAATTALGGGSIVIHSK